VISEDSSISSIATFNYRRAPFRKLDQLRVIDSMQGQGIVRDMLEIIEPHARARL
jgi:hypothetical protein